MKRNRVLLAAICSALFAFASSTASGLNVYKWSDSDGVTHYAEAPPESGLASLEILDVVVAERAPAAVTDYQSVLDVASSIEASRLARERARLEREKLLLQERQLRQSQNHAGTNDVYYLPYSRHRYPHKPYPYHYPVPTPHNNQPNGSVPGRVYLDR